MRKRKFHTKFYVWIIQKRSKLSCCNNEWRHLMLHLIVWLELIDYVRREVMNWFSFKCLWASTVSLYIRNRVPIKQACGTINTSCPSSNFIGIWTPKNVRAGKIVGFSQKHMCTQPMYLTHIKQVNGRLNNLRWNLK